MSIPPDRKYSETHEWFSPDGDIVTMGITQFAADELTDITYVELPEVGKHVSVGDVIGEVESVKATSEMFSAIDGEILEVNEELGDHPELINDDAFDDGWIVKIKVSTTPSLGLLMDAAHYSSFINGSH